MTRYDEFLGMQSQETDDCILWPYAKNGAGYGMIFRGGKKPLTHRLSCTMAHGQPPTTKHEAAHSCHTPSCLNPRHLRWATRSENQLDRAKDGTSNHGERSAHTHLTEFDVAAIRHYASCGTKQKVLASHYGVTQSCISEIVNYKTWNIVRSAA